MKKFLIMFTVLFMFFGEISFLNVKADSITDNVPTENVIDNNNTATDVLTEINEENISKPEQPEKNIEVNPKNNHADELSNENINNEPDVDFSANQNDDKSSELLEGNEAQGIEESEIIEEKENTGVEKRGDFKEKVEPGDLSSKADIKTSDSVPVSSTLNEVLISRIGHLNSGNVDIYADPRNQSNVKKAGTTYTGKVYYIKSQATHDGMTYYKISTERSSTSGVVGWVRASDMDTRTHSEVDAKAKTLELKGTGYSVRHPWGGKQDEIYSSLSSFKGSLFKVDKTELVGSAVWYRGILNGTSMWVHSNTLTEALNEVSINRIGHLNSGNVDIYADPRNQSNVKKAGTTYTGKVYYIKSQATHDGMTYYKISTERSSTSGVVGWVRASDMDTRTHSEVDAKAKTFELKGTGYSVRHPWGGKQDEIYSSLSSFKGSLFKVDKTELVGSAVWYRGILNGTSMWVHSNTLTEALNEVSISRIGHLNSSNVDIYADPRNQSNVKKAGTTYTGKVYYIKSQATHNGMTYYKISTERSSTSGVVGWVRASDMDTRTHEETENLAKTLVLNGKGYTVFHPWGGLKDRYHQNLTSYKGQVFVVLKAEMVGSALWYRGKVDGDVVWIHSSFAAEELTTYNEYQLTLEQMTDIQMKANPATDKKYKLWVREDAFKTISDGDGVVNGTWNLRLGPGVEYAVGEQVTTGTILPINGRVVGSDGFIWYHVKYTSGWVTPDREDLKFYLNPLNFNNTFRDKLQFLSLSRSANIDIAEVNEKVLKDKGILTGQALTFVEAGRLYGVNEIYLISHALLETGNGKSKLATGVEYNGKIVYNMYGVGAYDSCPLECGAKYAYEKGWFSPEAAIIGGAEFVGKNYISAGQNTLYKMRWNPAFANRYGYASHQYATDIGWAYKQTNRMDLLYSMLDSYTLSFEIPVYSN